MSAYDSLRASFWRPVSIACVSLVAACSGGNVGPLVTAITVPAATPVGHAPLCRSNADCSADMLITGLADSSRSSRMQTILQQVREDDSEYGRLKQGGLAPGATAPPTSEEMQHAAWLQSGSTQAEEFVVQLAHGL